jgi:Rod binding domain-containing protein
MSDTMNITSAAPRRLDAPASPTRETQEQTLRTAAQEFEGMFVNLLLKSMRSTVMESDLIENKGEMNTYRDLLDQEMSKNLGAGPNGLGIANLIIDRYMPMLDAIDASTKDGAQEMNPLPRPSVRKALDAYGPSAMPSTEQGGSLMSRAREAGSVVADTLRTYGPVIQKAADQTGLDPELILAVIVKESSGRADAQSSRGAQGLMQLMPATAAELGVTDSLDPVQNIQGGAKYLAYLRDRFGDDLPLVLAGYNAGPGNVERAGRTVPPFAETEKYVARVGDLYSQLKGENAEGDDFK